MSGKMENEKSTVEFLEQPEADEKQLGLSQPTVNGDAILVTSDGVVQRLPIPSADPNDPLNFSKWEKGSIIFTCCWFSIMSLALAGGLGAILVTFIDLYKDQTENDVVRLTTFPSLFIGIGNYFILPLSLVFGRRPVFLVSIFGLLLSTIGAAVNQSYSAHLAARIVQGFTTGATESLLPLMITEITFVHQRSVMFGYYWATQTALSSALNLASSYETAALSWRWYYWVFVFAIGFGFIVAIFGAFETRFKRPAMSLQGCVIVTDEYGVTHTLTGDEAAAYLASSTDSMEDGPRAKKSYLQMLKPWSGVADKPIQVMINSWYDMIKSMTSPAILFATILSATVLGCAIGISLTYDVVLEQNYGWSAENIGLINIGGFIGAVLGMVYAGWPADKLIIWLAKRNGGVMKPEYRLLMLPITGLIGLAGMILYGFTASGNATWWGPFIGWTMYEQCFVAVLIITTTFAAEAWPKNPGPALVMVVGSKNIIAFGISYALIPMVEKYSYKDALGILSGVHAGIFLLGIPVYLLNPIWRKKFLI